MCTIDDIDFDKEDKPEISDQMPINLKKGVVKNDGTSEKRRKTRKRVTRERDKESALSQFSRKLPEIPDAAFQQQKCDSMPSRTPF